LQSLLFCHQNKNNKQIRHTYYNLNVMKKRLEADLISIAHRILQLKNKSDINQLYLETQKLYEKLSILRFIDTHYGEIKPTIGRAEITKEIEAFYDLEIESPKEKNVEMTESSVTKEGTAEQEIVTNDQTGIAEAKETIEISAEENEEASEETENYSTRFEADIKEQQIDPVENVENNLILEDLEAENEDLEEITAEELSKQIDAVELSNEETLIAVDEAENFENEEALLEEEDTNTAFKAAFELSYEPEIETPVKQEVVQISFEDLLGGNYNDTLFVKVDEVAATPPPLLFQEVEDAIPLQEAESNEPQNATTIAPEKAEQKIVSLNDSFAKGINIDLNDQIAFVKHLFGNSNEDYNRVLNQLITFDNFYETRNFIEEMVKPDYNNWQGKEDYVDRFMDIIEKKFL
jgi:hypothetical protein